MGNKGNVNAFLSPLRFHILLFTLAFWDPWTFIIVHNHPLMHGENFTFWNPVCCYDSTSSSVLCTLTFGHFIQNHVNQDVGSTPSTTITANEDRNSLSLVRKEQTCLNEYYSVCLPKPKQSVHFSVVFQPHCWLLHHPSAFTIILSKKNAVLFSCSLQN